VRFRAPLHGSVELHRRRLFRILKPCRSLHGPLRPEWFLHFFWDRSSTDSGPRVCSVIANAGVAQYSLFLQVQVFCHRDSLPLILGGQIQVSIVHLANLFPENQFPDAPVFLNRTISTFTLSFATFILVGLTCRHFSGSFFNITVYSFFYSSPRYSIGPTNPLKTKHSSLWNHRRKMITSSVHGAPIFDGTTPRLYLRTDPHHPLKLHPVHFVCLLPAIESGNVNLVG
jgi:hypothetical protein